MSKTKHVTKNDLGNITSFYKVNMFNINITFHSAITGIDPTNFIMKFPCVVLLSELMLLKIKNYSF